MTQLPEQIPSPLARDDRVGTNIGPPGPAAAPRISYLDSLRGLAALSIAVFFHYQHFSSLAQPGGPPPDQAPLYGFLPVRLEYRYGGFAVDFFFILSGIVFSHVYAQPIAEGRTLLGRFWGLRLARLYPIHLGTLLLVALLAWTFHATTGRFPIYDRNGSTEFVLSLLFLQGGIVDRGLAFNGPTWSLSVEVLLYGLFYGVARCRADRPAAIAMVGVGLAILMSPVGDPVLINVAIARGLIGFALGMLVYRTVMSGERPVWALGGLALFAAAALALRLAGIHKLGFAAVSASLALAVAMLTQWRLPQRLLEIRPLILLGDASLSIYLVHIPIQIALLLAAAWAGRAIPYSSFTFWAGYFATVLAVAWVVHRWYERPMRHLLRQRLGLARA
jgi:peptidoglycan/LPS O-acetylase OafA/YrhL